MIQPSKPTFGEDTYRWYLRRIYYEQRELLTPWELNFSKNMLSNEICKGGQLPKIVEIVDKYKDKLVDKKEKVIKPKDTKILAVFPRRKKQ